MTDPRIRYDILANAEGEQDVARLAAEVEKLDDAFDPKVQERARALAEELRQLGQAQTAIGRFRELKGETQQAAKALEDAQAAAQKMGRELAETEKPTRAQVGQFEKLKDAVQAAKENLESKTRALDGSRAELGKLGVATDTLARSELQLRTALQATKQEVQQLGQQGQAVQRFQELAQATQDAKRRFEEADSAVESYRRGLSTTEAPTRAQTAELARLSESARQAQVAFQQSSQAQANAASNLRAAGVDTQRLSTEQGKLAPQLAATAKNAEAAAAQVRNLGDDLDGAGPKTTGFSGALTGVAKAVAGLFAVTKVAAFAKDAITVADEYGQMAERIQMATGRAEEYDLVQRRLLESANLTYRPLVEQQELYIRTADALRSLGYNTEQVLDVTDSYSYLLTTNAATAERAKNAIDAYTKSIQSGRVEVSSWQSIMAATPTIVDAIAAASGKTAEEVRRLGITGKLALADLNEGLRQSVELNKAAAAGMNATVRDAVTRLANTWSVYIGEANRASQSTQKIVWLIDLLSANLGTVVNAATVAGEVMVAVWGVKALGALKAYTAQLALAAAETTALMAATTAAGAKMAAGIAAAGKLAAAGWVGWEIGTFLRSEFVVVERAGIALAAGLTKAAARVQAAWEMVNAVFTGDTIAAAQERLRVQLAQIDDTYADLFANAGKATAAMGQGTKTAADAATAAGAAVASASAEAAAGVGGIAKAAETAEAAITALAASAGLKLPPMATTARAQASAMGELAGKSREAAEAVGTALPSAIAKLSGSELQRFRETFVAALGEGVQNATLLQAVLVETGKRAAQALGVDVAKATNTLSKEFATAQENLDLLVSSTRALGKAGLDAGKVVEAALRRMAESAKNQAELDELRKRIEALGKAGIVSKDQVGLLMDTVKSKAEEAAKSVSLIDQALKTFGITTQAELKKTADNFKQAWDRIKADATVTLDQKRQAFVQYANAAIAANGGVIDSQIRSQAQAFKLAVEVDKTGKAVVKAMDDGTKATDQLAAGMKRAGAELATLATQVGNLTAGWKAALDARNAAVQSTLQWEGRDASGNLDRNFVGSSGGSFFTPPPDASGDWVWQATASRPGGEWVLSPEASQRRFAEGEQARGLVPVRDASGSTRFVAPGGSGAAGFSPFNTGTRQVVVKLELGNRSASVPTTQEAADALLALLEQARRDAGD